MSETWLDALGDRPWSAVEAHVPAGRHEHAAAPAVQLRLVRRGSSYVTLDLGAGRRRVHTRPGDLVLSLPHSGTRFELDEPRDLLVVSIAAGHAEGLVRRAGGRSLRDLTALTVGPVRSPLVAELCRRLARPGGYVPAALDAALTLLVATLLEQARAASTRRGGTRLTGATLRQVLDHVERRLADPLPVDELAALVGLPRRAFAAEFKLATGLPVHQYVLRRRADRAVDLLTTTATPIADVAAELGFAHQAHLTRVLRRLTGATPAQHRARAGGP